MSKAKSDAAAKSGILQAHTGFVYFHGGIPQVVHRNDLIEASHPAYKGREHLFKEVETVVSPTGSNPSSSAVETTSANPGARRRLTRAESREAGVQARKAANTDSRVPGADEQTITDEEVKRREEAQKALGRQDQPPPRGGRPGTGTKKAVSRRAARKSAAAKKST